MTTAADTAAYAEELAGALALLDEASALMEEGQARRDRAIIAMHRRGISLRAIAMASGLTHTGVRKVLLREGKL